MTPGARKVLQELADDETADLLREGRTVYCGNRQTTCRVVDELLGVLAISILYRDGFETPTTYYGINDTGRALLRRPELETEIQAMLWAKTRTPFQIINDRVVALDSPEPEKGIEG